MKIENLEKHGLEVMKALDDWYIIYDQMCTYWITGEELRNAPEIKDDGYSEWCNKTFAHHDEGVPDHVVEDAKIRHRFRRNRISYGW